VILKRPTFWRVARLLWVGCDVRVSLPFYIPFVSSRPYFRHGGSAYSSGNSYLGSLLCFISSSVLHHGRNGVHEEGASIPGFPMLLSQCFNACSVCRLRLKRLQACPTGPHPSFRSLLVLVEALRYRERTAPARVHGSPSLRLTSSSLTANPCK
jgi:hypothetical protein